MIGYHLMCRLSDDRVIAATPSQRRLLARTVFGIAGPHGLLAFNAADTHLHVQLAEPPTVGPYEVARRLEIGLKLRLGLQIGFSPAHVRPIADQHHLYRCFGYILRQAERHGLDWDPYAEASSLPDLLGLRLLGGQVGDRVRQLMPRLRRETLVDYLGLESLVPSDHPLDAVIDAASATIAAERLTGGSRAVVEARRAAAAVMGDRLTVEELGSRLGLAPRSVSRLRHGPRDPRYLTALRLQLGLRAQRRE